MEYFSGFSAPGCFSISFWCEWLSTGTTLGSQWTDQSVSYVYHWYACGV
jgi:hypothetical protein